MKDAHTLIPMPGLTFNGSFAKMQSIRKQNPGRLKCQIITNTVTLIHMSIFTSIPM